MVGCIGSAEAVFVLLIDGNRFRISLNTDPTPHTNVCVWNCQDVTVMMPGKTIAPWIITISL